MAKRATMAGRKGRKKAAKKKAAKTANAETDKPEDDAKEVYAFLTRVECPGCGTLNNYALDTRGKYQRRTCRTNRCQHNTAFKGREPFTVQGKKPEKPL